MSPFLAEAHRKTLAIVMAAAAAASACGGGRQASALDDEGRAYVRLAVALGEHDPDSLDFYSGPDELVGDVRRNLPSLAEIRDEARSASERVARRADAATHARADLLTTNLRVLAARVDVLRGARMPYAREVRTFFGIDPPPSEPQRLAALREELARLLPGQQPLADRYRAFASRFVVAPQYVEPVLRAALEECRRRTLAHVPLPAMEHVDIEFVRDRLWSAYSRYHGKGRSTIQLNADFQFTVDQLLQLACHEGYPGHHTRDVLRDADQALAWPEHWAQLTFSPDAMVSEASATVAIDVAFSPEERVRVVRERLAPIAALDAADVETHVAVERLLSALQEGQADIANAYLDTRIEFERAVSALEEQTLAPHAESLVKYINEYRSYLATYTSGARLFDAQLAACHESRWDCFRRLTLQTALNVDNAAGFRSR